MKYHSEKQRSNEFYKRGNSMNEKNQPVVTRPKRYQKNRLGRGFSLKEIKAAAIPLDDAQKMNIPIDIRRKSVHDENVEKLSALYRQTTSTRTEAKIELDRSTKEAFKELKSLKGIRGDEAKLLIEAGIKSLKDLLEENSQSLADDTQIDINKIEKWIMMAKILIKRRATSESITELMQIKGMNRIYAQRLVDFGILTITDLSQENAEILAKDLKLSDKILSIWIEDAKRITGQITPAAKKPTKKPKAKPIEELKEAIPAAIEAKSIEKPKAKAGRKPKAKPIEEPKEAISAAIEAKPVKKPKAKVGRKPKTKPVEEPKEALPIAIETKPIEELKEELPEALQEEPIKKGKEEKIEILEKKPTKKPKEKPPEKPKVEVKKPLDLPDLKGIGKADLKKLRDLEIMKIEDLIEEDAEKLSTISGINKDKLQQWIGDIRSYLGLPRELEALKKEEAAETSVTGEDPLSKWLKIERIGKKTAEKLVKAGILDINELLEGDIKLLSKKSKISEKDLKKIIELIKEL